MDNSLVSIIIPTYNRAHLIGETLDSVLAQTYTNWECIIVDDGSTDNTAELLKTYCEKDVRFKYVQRLDTHKPGGNGARNYGFEVSKGKYINWFDSDDLMLSLFIQKKVELLEKEKLDFVISHSVNFNELGQESPINYSINDGKAITAENFINGTIFWMTIDIMVSRKSIGNLRFNEILKSGQEYNFYSRYLLNNPKGHYVNECLAKRRVHDISIQQQLLKNTNKRKKELLFNEMVLLNDIKGKASKKLMKRSLNRLIRLSYETQRKFTLSKVQFSVLKELVHYGNLISIGFYAIWIISNLIVGKGYFLLKRAYL